MENAFEVKGLDANLDVVSLMRYINLQWNRKYNEPGTFSIQIPKAQYNSEIKYIYTANRPELGKVTQVNYIKNDNYEWLNISGYFVENDLNSRLAYKKGSGNITSDPGWLEQTGAAEDVATAFFNGFKDITFTDNDTTYNCELGILTSTSQGRGKTADHVRQNEYLGNKIYTILKPSGMSYRINFDYVNKTKTFEAWAGLDRTQENTDGNNPAVFSTRFGNLKNLNILTSTTDMKNAYVVVNTTTSDGVETVTALARTEKTDSSELDLFVNASSSATRSDYSSDDEFQTAMHTEGHTELLKYPETVSFDFEALEGSYVYMQDFDLGDLVSIEVPEISLSVDARLVCCNEVIKENTWTLNMEFEI